MVGKINAERQAKDNFYTYVDCWDDWELTISQRVFKAWQTIGWVHGNNSAEVQPELFNWVKQLYV